MTKEINQPDSVDLGGLKNIFAGIINDEEHHRQLREQIKEIIDNRAKVVDNFPVVK